MDTAIDQSVGYPLPPPLRRQFLIVGMELQHSPYQRKVPVAEPRHDTSWRSATTKRGRWTVIKIARNVKLEIDDITKSKRFIIVAFRRGGGFSGVTEKSVAATKGACDLQRKVLSSPPAALAASKYSASQVQRTLSSLSHVTVSHVC